MSRSASLRISVVVLALLALSTSPIEAPSQSVPTSVEASTNYCCG